MIDIDFPVYVRALGAYQEGLKGNKVFQIVRRLVID